MRFPSLSCCLLATAISTAVATSIEVRSPEPTPMDAAQEIEARQATIQNIAATQNPLQVPPITTVYMPTSFGTSNTWLPFPYTQTFPAIPDQWPSPAQGQIGYGTLTKEKRDAEITPPPELIAVDTGIAGRIRI